MADGRGERNGGAAHEFGRPAFRYPCPDDWIPRREFSIVTRFALTLVFSALFVLIGVVALRDGQWMLAGFTSFAAVAFVGFGAAGFHRDRTGLLIRVVDGFWGSSGRDGVRLSVSVGWAWVEVVALASLGVSSVCFALGTWFETIPPDITPRSHLVLLITMLALGLMLVYQSGFRWSRSSRGLVVLTSTGIEIAGSIRARSLCWDDVTDVSPVSFKSRGGRQPAIMIRAGRTAQLSIVADQLAIGAPAAFWLIDFYWRNPDARWELSTGRSVERLRDGSIVEDADRHVRSEP